MPSLDQAQQIFSKHFKDHANMYTIGAFVIERVEQADDVLPSGVVGICFDNLFQEFDFVYSSLGVVGSRADNLESDMFARGVVAREPDGREMTPAKFPHHCVLAIVVLLANGDGMVAAFAIIFGILLISCAFCIFILGATW